MWKKMSKIIHHPNPLPPGEGGAKGLRPGAEGEGISGCVKGFTLVELLVAAAVFSLGMLAVCGLFMRSVASVPELRANDAADMIGQQTIEQINSQGCCVNSPGACTAALTTIAALNSPASPVIGNAAISQSVTVPWVVNSVSYTVTAVLTNTVVSGSNLEQTDVTVTWTDRYRVTKTEKYETYL
jgi:prepilin-type N-terminal cleavage/methylation domain-containing protein